MPSIVVVSTVLLPTPSNMDTETDQKGLYVVFIEAQSILDFSENVT